MSVSNPGNLLDGPERTQQHPDGPDLQRCAQCGRVGTRAFKTYPPGDFGGPALTICANKAACRKRWPKQPYDDAA